MTEIIAEIGQNFNGDLDLAVKMIHEAKKAGADVVKFQLFNAKKLFSKENNPWYEYNLNSELSRDDVFRLADTCSKVGIEFFASAFDPERVEWLEETGVKRHKVASRSIQDRDLFDVLKKTNKPLLVSLGYWNKLGFPDLKTDQPVHFLYCISMYPTPLSDVHLKSVDFKRFDGFSDHTIELTASKAAMVMGAKIIEKHFTLDQKMAGPDHLCSMTPGELKSLCKFRDELELCL